MTEPKTILLVEDEPLLAVSETKVLRKEGYEVLLASSGEEAIARVDAAPQAIALILMAIDLGAEMDGIRAAQEILKTHDIPIVFLSSHTEPEVVSRAASAAAYGYVVKGSGIAVLTVISVLAWSVTLCGVDSRVARSAAEMVLSALGRVANEVQSAIKSVPAAIVMFFGSKSTVPPPVWIVPPKFRVPPEETSTKPPWPGSTPHATRCTPRA